MAIELVPFTPEMYEKYLDRLLVGYTAEKIRAGNVSPENAEEKIRKEIAQLLPEGLQTPMHTFYQICQPETAEKVGIVWVFFHPEDSRKMAFVYDIEIFEPHRRKGYASQALLAVEDYLRQQGARQIGLHVFGFNTGAQALYLKLGYEITNIQMAKTL